MRAEGEGDLTVLAMESACSKLFNAGLGDSHLQNIYIYIYFLPYDAGTRTTYDKVQCIQLCSKL